MKRTVIVFIMTFFTFCGSYAVFPSNAEEKITPEMYLLGYLDTIDALMDYCIAFQDGTGAAIKPEEFSRKLNIATKMINKLYTFTPEEIQAIKEKLGKANIVRLKTSFDKLNETIKEVKKSTLKDNEAQILKEWDNVSSIFDGFYESNLTSSVSPTKKIPGDISANMHSLQVMVETYAVDWGGIYPNDLNALFTEAKKVNYWKDFENPFTKKHGIGKDGAMLEYSVYNHYKQPQSAFKGLILYNPSGKPYTSYVIYGCNQNGDLSKDDNGKVYLLTNS